MGFGYEGRVRSGALCFGPDGLGDHSGFMSLTEAPAGMAVHST